jgi:hypothetical protein
MRHGGYGFREGIDVEAPGLTSFVERETVVSSILLARSMTNVLNPYLYFDGLCEEAFKFYEKCLGGKITFMMTW